MLISIIIPTYNRAHLIRDTLDSVVAQTYTNWECIVVDDGSSDNTKQVVESYVEKDSKFQYYERPDTHKKGGNGARNFGFTKAKGNYIQWFDSDDLMESTLLEKQILSLNLSSKKISVCQFEKYNHNFSEKLYSTFENKVTHNAYLDYAIKRVKINLQTTLWHKSIVLNNQFNEYLSKAQEYDFIIKVLKTHYHQVVFVNQILVKVRSHSNSITGDVFKNRGNDKKIYDSIAVRFNVLKSFDKKTPKDVVEKLNVFFIKELLKAFSYKKTNILFYFLFKNIKVKYLRGFLMLLYTIPFYLLYVITDKGWELYKKIVAKNIL